TELRARWIPACAGMTDSGDTPPRPRATTTCTLRGVLSTNTTRGPPLCRPFAVALAVASCSDGPVTSGGPTMAHVYAGLGRKVYLYRDPQGRKKFRQVLWGDWLQIDEDRQDENGFRPIVWAKNDPDKRADVWIKAEETVETRPLEIIFVDVGQGDGAVLITPEQDDN